jgi:hypothetical protein
MAKFHGYHFPAAGVGLGQLQSRRAEPHALVVPRHSYHGQSAPSMHQPWTAVPWPRRGPTQLGRLREPIGTMPFSIFS